jgi:hypothetical protein
MDLGEGDRPLRRQSELTGAVGRSPKRKRGLRRSKRRSDRQQEI